MLPTSTVTAAPLLPVAPPDVLNAVVLLGIRPVPPVVAGMLTVSLATLVPAHALAVCRVAVEDGAALVAARPRPTQGPEY